MSKRMNRSMAMREKKITKEAANYVSHYKIQKRQCEACSMFRPNTVNYDSCTLVIGMINPEGHCKYWEAKSKLPVAERE